MIRSLVLLIALMCKAMPVTADISGHDDLAFQTALESWLEGDDRVALADMSKLANANVTAAQVFLGQIEVQTWLHAHVTGSLERSERIALLRNPKGLSGRSWLLSAAEAEPHAQLLLDDREPASGIALGRQLAEAGETALALRQITRGLYASGDVLAALELALHPDLAPFASGFVQPRVLDFPGLVAAGVIDPTDPRIAALQEKLSTMPSFDLAGAHMWGRPDDLQAAFDDPTYLRELALILMDDPRLSRLVQLLAEVCPDDPPLALAAVEMSEPLWPAFAMSFSPVPSLISDETYQSSVRFDADILRRVGFDNSRLNMLQRMDACIYEQARQTRAR